GHQDAVRQGVGLLAEGEVALVEPGAAAVDAPPGVAVADSQGGQGGQQQQEEGQDEPPVQAGVLEGGEGGDGHRVASQGDGDERAAAGSRQVFDPAGSGCAYVGTICIYSYIRCCEPTTTCGARQATVPRRSPDRQACGFPPGANPLKCLPFRPSVTARSPQGRNRRGAQLPTEPQPPGGSALAQASMAMPRACCRLIES